LDRKRVEIDPELAKGLSQVERRLIQLYYVDDAAPERLESELGIPYEEAMRRLAEIGEVEYAIEWRHEGDSVTLVRRKRHEDAS
jgi:hypothetical protein